MADYRIRIVVDGEDKGAGRMLDGLGGSLGRIGEFAAGSLLADGIKAVGSGIAGLGGAMLGAAMEAADLNAQISGIVALSGGGQGDIQALKDTISSIAVNPDLVVGADEAAGVIQELIANGLQLSDIYDGAAESTVLLANATGAEFTTAATVASDTMSIFGIKAEDMMTAVNGITGVVNASKFDINDYALALSQGGGIAAAVGVEFDDFNAAITAMSSRFASGSDAGTSFKTMLQRLIPQSDDAKSAMVDLGLYTYDYAAAAQHLSKQLGTEVEPNVNGVTRAFQDWIKISGKAPKSAKDMQKAWTAFIEDFEQNQFFDANGQLKDMGDIVGALNGAFAGLTEEQKLNFATTIAGSDAMRAMLGLADMTEAEFRQLMATMGETDALESAGIRTDNLKGDMDRFAGTLEDVRKRVGDSWGPALRSMYQSGNRLLTNLSPGLIAAADGVAGYIEQVTPKVTSAIEGFVSKFEEAYTKIGGGIPGAIAGLSAGIGADITLDATGKITTIQWGDFVGTLDWNNYVTSLSWGDYTISIDWNDWITKFEWGNVAVALDWSKWGSELEWGDYVATFDWTSRVSQIQWGDFLARVDWANLISKVTWGDYIAVFNWQQAFSRIQWGDFIAYLDWGRMLSTVRWGDYIVSLDWAKGITTLVWGDYVATFDWGQYLPSLNWSDYVVVFSWGDFTAKLDWTNWITSFSWGDYAISLNWGQYVSALSWSNIVATFASWSDYINKLTWTDVIIGVIEWTTYIPVLAWNTMISAIDWGTWLFTLDWGTYITGAFSWGAYVTALSWNDFITSTVNWANYITSLPWSDYITGALNWASYVQAVSWDSFVSKLNWPSAATVFTWSTWISALKWPTITWPGWTTWIKFPSDITWPGWDNWISFPSPIHWPGWTTWIKFPAGISWPGWDNWIDFPSVPDFPGWSALWDYITGNSSAQNHSTGTNFFSGGLSWVGEKGPELVNFPRGTQILNHERSMAYAGAMSDGSGGGPVTIINHINNRLDIHALTRQVADELRRNR